MVVCQCGLWGERFISRRDCGRQTCAVLLQHVSVYGYQQTGHALDRQPFSSFDNKTCLTLANPWAHFSFFLLCNLFNFGRGTCVLFQIEQWPFISLCSSYPPLSCSLAVNNNPILLCKQEDSFGGLWPPSFSLPPWL